MADLSDIITPNNVLTATSTNTVTNKTIAYASNTLTGVVGETATQTLTNKTISGANNTLTNVSLTTAVTGTLPVANGGTGAVSLTANNVLLGNGTSALQAVAPGTSGNVLVSNGTTWTSSALAIPPYIKNITPWYVYRAQAGGNFPIGMFGKISDGSYIVGVQDGGAKIQVIQYASGVFTAGTQLTLTTYTASQCLVAMLTSTVGVAYYREGASSASLRAFTVSGNTITLTGTALSVNADRVYLARINDTSCALGGGGSGADIFQYTVTAGQVSLTRNVTNTASILSDLSIVAITPTILLILADFGGAAAYRSYLFNGTSWVQTSSTASNLGFLSLSPNYSGNVYDAFSASGATPTAQTFLQGITVNTTTAVTTATYGNRTRYLPAGGTSLGGATTWNYYVSSTDSIFKLNATQTLVLSSPNTDTQSNPTQLLYPALYILDSNANQNSGGNAFSLVPIGGSAVLGAKASVRIFDYISSSQTLLVSGVANNGQSGLTAFSLAGYL